jgi:hypothetical protein
LLQEGAEFQRIGMTLQDAQYVEGSEAEPDRGRQHLPHPRLVPRPRCGVESQTFEQDNLRFYTMGIAPGLRRIELALFTDPDLFPQRQIYPEFDVSAASSDRREDTRGGAALPGPGRLKACRRDPRRRRTPTTAAVPVDPTQEPGKVPQVTPVGGAPNDNLAPPEGGNTNANSDQQKASFHLHFPETAPPVVHNHVASPDVNVTTPDVHVEPRFTIEAAQAPDVHISPAEVRVDAPITVEAAKPAECACALSVEAAKTPDVHIEPLAGHG